MDLSEKSWNKKKNKKKNTLHTHIFLLENVFKTKNINNNKN